MRKFHPRNLYFIITRPTNRYFVRWNRTHIGRLVIMKLDGGGRVNTARKNNLYPSEIICKYVIWRARCLFLLFTLVRQSIYNKTKQNKNAQLSIRLAMKRRVIFAQHHRRNVSVKSPDVFLRIANYFVRVRNKRLSFGPGNSRRNLRESSAVWCEGVKVKLDASLTLVYIFAFTVGIG